jgi:taurine dioxygenase
MQAYTNIKVAPLTPAIGAEISDVDLGAPTPGQLEDIRAALLDYKVIFFRNQPLTQEQHISFARQFGELEIHPATPRDQPNPEAFKIEHGPSSRGAENMWHSDVTWRERPSLGSILRAVEIPEVGGDTLFANMALAYNRLPEATKEKIRNRTAIHDIARVFASRLKKDPEELREQYPLVAHPVVRTHPETKEQVIYVNEAFTSHIEDVDPEESRSLLDQLYKSAWNPEVQCRFRWQPDSIAFWDNRASQHFAASDYFPAIRKMVRVTIAGDKPYFDASARI